MIRILIVLTLGFLVGCEYLQKSEDDAIVENSPPVVRVYDKYLYQSELDGLVPSRTSPQDSADLVERYIDTWIKKQLLLTKAEQNVKITPNEIERRVQDYKYQLIVYGYEKQFVEDNLDTAISITEIEEYYNNNLQNFELKQNIIKGVYLKVPLEAPNLSDVKTWLFATDSGSREELSSFAYTYANKYVMNDSTWFDFDETIVGTPFQEEITSVVNTLKRKKFLESQDSLYLYLLKINDYQISESASAPLDLVDDQIRNIIIHKRKIELMEKHENEIFENATKNNHYEILSN